MRKASLLMLTSLILIAAGMLAPTPVKAQLAILEIPSQTVPQKGVNFNVTIWTWNVTDLWAFGISLKWNPSICNYTRRVWPGNAFQGRTASSIMVDSYDNTVGYVYGIAQTLLAPPPTGVTGSFSLIIVEFYAKEYGATGLNFTDPPPPKKPTGMMNTAFQLIPHEKVVYPVTVVPEFPAHLLMPLFLIVTMIAVVLAKTVWSKRLRGRVDVK